MLTHKFFHLLLLSKSERATVEGWGPRHREDSAVQSQAAEGSCRSVLMKHLCDQGKELQQEVSTLWSYTDDEKEADWMLSRLQGKPDPSAEGRRGSLRLLDWKTENGPFLGARRQAEGS